MPPHARSKRPSARRFISGGQGEWSVTIMSIMPARSPCHSAVAIRAPADRRRALQQRGAVGNLLRGEVQIVRTGLDRDGQTLSPRGLQLRAAPAQWTDARCAGGSRYCRHKLIISRIACNSASSGREARYVAYLRQSASRKRGRRRIDRAGQFRVHQQRQSRLGNRRQRALQLLAVDHGEAVAAGVDEEALEARNSRRAPAAACAA